MWSMYCTGQNIFPLFLRLQGNLSQTTRMLVCLEIYVKWQALNHRSIDWREFLKISDKDILKNCWEIASMMGNLA